MSKIYPDHFQTLNNAQLLKGVVVLTMGELWSNLNRKTKVNEAKFKDPRNVYFCIGFFKYWKRLLHQGFQELLKRADLPWLRIRLSYHWFTNLYKHLQADLTAKLNHNILSLDFMDRECNRSKSTKIEGKCPYNGICWKTCIVYEATCRLCKYTYIGNTQQIL